MTGRWKAGALFATPTIAQAQAPTDAEAPTVTRELLRRGYSEAQVTAIWGGNFLRVLGAAEAGRMS